MVKYNISMRILHWLMAILILCLIAVGFYMEGLPKEDPIKYTLYGLHKSFGVMIIFLFVVRIITRIRSSIPPLPEGIKPLEKKLSHGIHHLLYLFMILVPVSGYVMSDAGGHDVKFFGLLMPDFFEKNKEIGGIAHEMHEIIPYVLLGIVILHVAGAIKHRFFEPKENDVIGRML